MTHDTTPDNTTPDNTTPDNTPKTRKQGFTLIELLITLVVGMLVISAAVSITIASNRMFRVDRARTRMNQNLRASSDLIGTDVRTAGSYLPNSGLQPVVVRSGNELEIRRSLLSSTLPVCVDIKGQGTDVIKIGSPGNSTPDRPACDDEGRDADNDGWPDDLAEWRDYRLDTDVNTAGTVAVYIWPASDGSSGEFFIYDDEDNSQQQIHKGPGQWQHQYVGENEPNMYVLEMRRYQLSDDGILQLIINGNEDNPLNLVNNITDFQVRAVLTDGTIVEDFGDGMNNTTDKFTDIASIEINVQAEEEVMPDQLVSRELNNRFFPRNILNF